jgi:hypothetical protein
MFRQFLLGTKENIKNQSIVNGQILFSSNTSNIYYDINGIRREVSGILYVDSDSDLMRIAYPEEKLYISRDSKRVFAYNASTQEFIQVNRTGVVNNLTSSQRMALTSCAEDCIYIDSDTMEMYVGVNMSSNSSSISMFGNVYWRKIGESISNYDGLVNIRTNGENVISTDSNGNIEIGNESNSLSINAKKIYFNGNQQNTAGGMLVLDGSGRIPSNLIPSGIQQSSNSSSTVQASVPFITNITNTSFTPTHNFIYHKDLSTGDSFSFTAPSDSSILSFRLYLSMSEVVSFGFAQNIVWKESPNFATANSLYILSFEWNPIINKWLAEMAWGPISLV